MSFQCTLLLLGRRAILGVCNIYKGTEEELAASYMSSRQTDLLYMTGDVHSENFISIEMGFWLKHFIDFTGK